MTADNAEKEKPCGTYHPLPCGLDEECEVPVDHFRPSVEDNTIWEEYKQNTQID